MEAISEIEKLSTKDTLKNMYFNVFTNRYNSEDYFRQKKIAKKGITRLFDNLKLDEVIHPLLYIISYNKILCIMSLLILNCET